MKLYVRRSIESDIGFVAENMRESDRLEIWRSNRANPADSLTHGFNGEICLTFCINDEPAAMFGVNRVSYLSQKGIPWLLGTDKIKYAMMYFLKESRKHVQAMNKRYPILENYVDSDNKLSIRWLKWLGFELREPAIINNHKFIRFERSFSNV